MPAETKCKPLLGKCLSNPQGTTATSARFIDIQGNQHGFTPVKPCHFVPTRTSPNEWWPFLIFLGRLNYELIHSAFDVPCFFQAKLASAVTTYPTSCIVAYFQCRGENCLEMDAAPIAVELNSQKPSASFGRAKLSGRVLFRV